MISQELIEYVKGQLAAGVTREKITSDLLNGGGWSNEEIDEAFGFNSPTEKVTISEPAITESTLAAPEETPLTAPTSIKIFEWLMYASFAASIVVWLMQSALMGQLAMQATLVGPLIAMFIKFLFVYKVVYQRREWARITIAVLVAFNVFSLFGMIALVVFNPLFILGALPMILEIIALYFLFLQTSNSWLVSSPAVGEGIATIENPKWSKIIPRTNQSSLVVSAVLVFGLDLMILMGSPDLLPFFIAMLLVFALFGGFYHYENRTLKPKFINSNSNLDTWFVVLITVRNFVFILNFIPLIQVLGFGALIIGFIPYLVAYILLVRARNKVVAVTVT